MFSQLVINIVAGVLRALPRKLRYGFYRSISQSMTGREHLRAGLFTMNGSLNNLRDWGFDPETIVDVGANVGEWTRSTASIFPDARYFLFEAQHACADFLRKTCAEVRPQAEYSIALLAAQAGDSVPFFELGTGSSIFEETTGYQSGRSLKITRTLDECLEKVHCSNGWFLKLDVQGAELEVLRGGRDVLLRSEVVLLEVALLEYNKGAPLIDEVVEFMSENGFVLFDICGILRRWEDAALFQVDLIFCRKTSKLRSERRFWPG